MCAGLLPGAQIAERPGGLTSTRPKPRCARPRARAPGARALPQPGFAGPARAAVVLNARKVASTVANDPGRMLGSGVEEPKRLSR